jgi:hypothetical protein
MLLLRRFIQGGLKSLETPLSHPDESPEEKMPQKDSCDPASSGEPVEVKHKDGR